MKKKGWGKKSTPKKKLGIGSPVFCTFSFTLTHGHVQAGGGGGGGGAQLFLISYVARLHGICNGTHKRMEVGEGGTTSSLTALRLGISVPTPNF